MASFKQESDEYASALHQAEEYIKRAQKAIKAHEYETLSREDAIAYRTLTEIQRKISVLEENAWFLKNSSR